MIDISWQAYVNRCSKRKRIFLLTGMRLATADAPKIMEEIIRVVPSKKARTKRCQNDASLEIENNRRGRNYSGLLACLLQGGSTIVGRSFHSLLRWKRTEIKNTRRPSSSFSLSLSVETLLCTHFSPPISFLLVAYWSIQVVNFKLASQSVLPHSSCGLWY